MKYTPISINKKEKTYKSANGKAKKYAYYEAVCTVQGENKSFRQTGSGKTRQAAKDALLKKLDAIERANVPSVPVRSKTLSQAIEHFLDYKLSEVWAESTYSRNKTTLKHQIAPFPIAQKAPLEVKHDDILAHIEALKNIGASKCVQDKAYSLLQLYFNYVYQDNRNQNPCYGIHLGYSPKLSSEHILNSEEVKRFFDACNTLGGNTDILQFIFLTYERSGEASTLKFSDWNRQDGLLKIARTRTVDKSGHSKVSEEGKTKTKSSTRSFKLNSLSIDILKRRYEARVEKLGNLADSAYIWPQAQDESKPMDYNTLRRLLLKVLEEAGIDKHITLHGLRHSGITFYGKDKNQLLTISKNAGHSRPSITEDIYSHVLDEHLEAAALSANNMNLFLQGQTLTPFPVLKPTEP